MFALLDIHKPSAVRVYNQIDKRTLRAIVRAVDSKWDWVNRGAGKRIADARKRAGLAQRELAQLVGMSRASIANIEAGKQPLQLQMIFVLADHLGVGPADLIPLRSDSGASVDLSDFAVVADLKQRLPDLVKVGSGER